MAGAENGVEGGGDEQQQQPLLEGDTHEQATAEMEEGESSSFSIQRAIYTHPDRAVRWLISKGSFRLGSFKVQVEDQQQLC